MPYAGSFPPGPYPEPPTLTQTEEFLGIVRETGQPERIPGLSRSKPDLTLMHEIVCHITVKQRERVGGEYVPCSICGDKPKFLNGRLLWSPDGFLRLIGHCCASRYFGNDYSHMQDRARRKRQLVDNQNWLMDHLPKLAQLTIIAEQLLPAAKFLQAQRRIFLRDSPRLADMLRQAIKESGGVLTVTRKRSSSAPTGFHSSSGGKSEYETEVVGRVRGHDFLNPNFAPVSKVNHLVTDLQSLAVRDVVNADDALNAVAAMSEVEVTETTKKFLSALKAGPAIADKLNGALAFLGSDCLPDIKNWGEHPDCPVRVDVAIRHSTVRFRLDENNVALLGTNAPSVPTLSEFAIDPPLA